MKLNRLFLKWIFFLVLSGVGSVLYAQNSYKGLFPFESGYSDFITDYRIKAVDNGTFHIDFKNQNFLKNDEYFSDLTAGLTYLGSHLQPSIQYQPYSNIKLSLGVSALYFSGLERFHKVQPVYTINYQPSEGFNILMGSINGGFNHSLHEALYAYENPFLRPVESGVQILLNKLRFKGDIWIDWRHFIFKNANQQEKIVGGAHLNYTCFQWEKYQLNADFQSFIFHKGGQYTVEGQVMKTIINTSLGFSLLRYLGDASEKENYLGVRYKHFNYFEITRLSYLPYNQGWSSSSSVFMNYKNWKVNLEYWYGKYFISSKGQALLMSISQTYGSVRVPNPQVLMAKLQWQKEVSTNVFVSLRFEPYFDINALELNYSYSLHMIFNSRFFLWKKK